MFKIIDSTTGKIVGTHIATDREAQQMAIAYVALQLNKTREGRRYIGWCKNGKLTWEASKPYVMIEEMIGDWIVLLQSSDVPEKTTDDFEIVFVTKKLKRYLGCYDAEEGLFLAQDKDMSFTVEKIHAYLIIPEDSRKDMLSDD
jgi:hypothetical protein